MAHDVFISYSTKDKIPADAVCATLERHGIRCWIAPRDVLPGMEWGEAIVDAITASRAMVLVVSASANDSPQIRREVERAVNKGVPILPFRIEEVMPSKSLEYFLGAVHWLDALTPPLEQHLDNLAQMVARLIPPKTDAAPASAPPTPAPAPVAHPATPAATWTAPRSFIPRWVYAGAGSLAALALLVVIGNHMLTNEPGVGSPTATPPGDTVTVSSQPPGPHAFLPERTLAGHTQTVTAVAFGPDSRTLASASVDETIRLWDLVTGAPRHTFSGHSDDVWAIAFNPDGKWLVSAGDDKLIKFWDTTSGKELREIKTDHRDWIRGVAISPDGKLVASGALDEKVKLWDAATGSLLRTLAGHPDDVWSVAFSPDGKVLASAGDDKTIRFWDPATGQTVRTLTGHTDRIRAIAFNPEGTLLASGGYDMTVKLWDVATGKEVRSLMGHTGGLRAVAFSPNGRWVASAGHDKSVRMWDVKAGTEMHVLTGHTDWVAAINFGPRGHFLATGSADKSVRLWRRVEE
jgi:dipeptidyl aminopeptidase/acylaminoacyl peptidase